MRVNPEMSMGIGYNTDWLAFKGIDTVSAAQALGLKRARGVPWSAALDVVSLGSNRQVAVSPPIPSDGADWVLATSRNLFELDYDLAALSRATATEVQGFATRRVIGLQSWRRARDGVLERAFTWCAEIGEVSEWVGTPDSCEVSAGLPPVGGCDETTGDAVLRAGIDENVLLSVAGSWSVNPASDRSLNSSSLALIGSRPSRRVKSR